MRDLFVQTEIALFGPPPKPRTSIPIKSLPRRAIEIEPKNLLSRSSITPREATAILIASRANGSRAIQPGARIPRSFVAAGANWIIEKGCGQDIVRSGAAGWIPGLTELEDAFVASADFVAWLNSTVSSARLAAFYAAELPSSLQPVRFRQ